MKRIAIAVAVLLAACAREQPARSVAQPHLTPLNVSFRPILGYAPIMIAKEEKEFEREGIDVELVSLDLNSTMFAAADGKLDVLSIPIRSGIFNEILRGVPLRIVADKGHGQSGRCVTEAFVAPVETAERIRGTGTLRGERVAYFRGGIMEFMVERLLARQGLTQKDIEIVQAVPSEQVVGLPEDLEAIRWVYEPDLTNLMSRGKTQVVASIDDVGDGMQLYVLLYSRRLLEEDPDLGRRFMRAYLRGVRRYNEGKTPRNVAIVSAYTKLPEDLIRRVCWPAIANDGVVHAEAVEPFLKWAREHKYLDGDVPVSQWWNGTFVEAANRDLGAK